MNRQGVVIRARLITAAVVTALVAIPAMDLSVPPLINYQGRVNDGAGMPIHGPVSMHFALLNGDTSSATVLWGETQPAVTVNQGIYSVMLGSSNPIPASALSGSTVYLEVMVNGEVMLPRQRVTSAAYSLRAGDAVTLNGVPASNYARTSDYYTKAEVDTMVAWLQDQITASGPPEGVFQVSPGFTVDHDARTYPRIQDAVNAAKSLSPLAVEIIVYPGSYNEDVRITNNPNQIIELNFHDLAILNGTTAEAVPALTISDATAVVANLYALATAPDKDVYIYYGGTTGGSLVMRDCYVQPASGVALEMHGAGGLAYVVRTVFDTATGKIGVKVDNYASLETGFHNCAFRPNGPQNTVAFQFVNSHSLFHITESAFNPRSTISIDSNSLLTDLMQCYLDASQVSIASGGTITNWVDRGPHTSPGDHIEKGSASLVVDGADNGSAAVTFSTTFNSAPKVTIGGLSSDIGGQAFVLTTISNITGAGFTANFKSLGGATATGSATFDWMAMGQ